MTGTRCLTGTGPIISNIICNTNGYDYKRLNELRNECAEPLLQWLEGKTDAWSGCEGFDIEEAFLLTVKDPCSSVEEWIENIIFEKAYYILAKI